MKKDTEQTTGQAVMDFVGFFDPYRRAQHKVLIGPKTLGSMALLVDEEPGGIDVGNFRMPYIVTFVAAAGRTKARTRRPPWKEERKQVNKPKFTESVYS